MFKVPPGLNQLVGSSRCDVLNFVKCFLGFAGLDTKDVGESVKGGVVKGTPNTEEKGEREDDLVTFCLQEVFEVNMLLCFVLYVIGVTGVSTVAHFKNVDGTHFFEHFHPRLLSVYLNGHSDAEEVRSELASLLTSEGGEKPIRESAAFKSNIRVLCTACIRVVRTVFRIYTYTERYAHRSRSFLPVFLF